MQNADRSRKRHRLDSPEPARGHRLLLLLSLSLNLGLLLFLVFVCRTPAPKAAPAIQFNSNPIQESGRSMRKDSKRAATPASPWNQLESPDLAVYAANLRAVGCPEKTVRDILLPWVEEQFDHAEQPVPGPADFWASFSKREAAEAARAGQENAREQQREQTLKDLLGFAWTSGGLKQAREGKAAIFSDFLDYERAEKLVCIADRFEQKFSRADPLKEKDRRLAIYRALRQEVAGVLSPAEFEETELRAILMISQRRNPSISKAGLSGAELRQLMAFKRELCNPIQSALLEGVDEPFQDPYSTGEQQFNAKARSLLGDSRFIDYLKTCDAGVERTLETLEKARLPRGLALQLFDIRQDAMARAREIRQLPARRAEKRARLAAVRQSAIEQIAALSNSATDGPLVKINLDWLQETANP